jgi:hypothetical protein
MEADVSSATLLSIYRTTRCHVPEKKGAVKPQNETDFYCLLDVTSHNLHGHCMRSSDLNTHKHRPSYIFEDSHYEISVIGNFITTPHTLSLAFGPNTLIRNPLRTKSNACAWKRKQTSITSPYPPLCRASCTKLCCFVWNILWFTSCQWRLVRGWVQLKNCIGGLIGIVTGYELDGRGSIRGREKILCSIPQRRDRLLGPPSLLFILYRGVFLQE